MALVVIPATEASVLVDATPSPLDRVQKRARNAHLGRGLIRPFRRDPKADFVNAEGEAVVRACLGQILGMQGSSDFVQGELEWAPERGALLYLLRHQNNDIVLRELGRVYVLQAIARFEPRVQVKSTDVFRMRSPDGNESTLVIKLVYDIIRRNVAGNQVYLSGVDQTIELKAA